MKDKASRYHATKYPELEVYIDVRPAENGGYRIRGTAVEAGTAIKYPDIAPARGVSVKKELNREVIGRIVYQIEERYKVRYRNGKDNCSSVSESTENCLSALLEEIASSDFRITPSWTSRDTNRSAVTYFMGHTMKWLRPFLTGDKKFLPETDTRELSELFAKEIGASKRAHDIQSVERSVSKRMWETEVILKYLYLNVEGFPSICLQYDRTAHMGSVSESPKYINKSVFRAYCALLKAEAFREPKTVLCALVQVHGARTAEAAAIKPSDFLFSGEYASVNIFNQEKDGKRTPILKTDVSNRVIVFGDWGTAIAEICFSRLSKEDSEDKSEICNITATALNCWVVQKLRDSGLEESLLEAYMSSASENAEKKNFEFSSYILRRHFAGIARNVMGMSIEETNAMLGHTNKCSPNDPNVRERLARKISRFSFDCEIQRNPWVHPVGIQSGNSHTLGDYTGYIYKNDSLIPIELTVEVAANEIGTEVVIGLEADYEIEAHRESEPVDYSEINKLVVGDTTI